MPDIKKKKLIHTEDITNLFSDHYLETMIEFYEMHSSLLTGTIRRYESIETASIVIAFASQVHLEIIRQREKNLDHDISLNNFFGNFNAIVKPTHKITSIVDMTGIPKETARRKIRKLIGKQFLCENSNREYSWCLTKNQYPGYQKIISEEITVLGKFISKFSDYLGTHFSIEEIKKELQNNFSFYWFHFLTCRLKWLSMWQYNLKDLDLILILIQALIPTLQYADKKYKNKKVEIADLHLAIGKTDEKYKQSNFSISAASISEVSGIPRATCIRKLEKLVNLGIFVRETKTKRYYVNQVAASRTKNILTKDNVQQTVAIFSDFVAIVLNAMVRNRSYSSKYI